MKTRNLRLDFSRPVNPLPHEEIKRRFAKLKAELKRRFEKCE